MRRLIYALVFLSASGLAHEIQTIGQHIKLNRQHESAWQFDLSARATVSDQIEAGLQAGYLERFDLYEKRGGGFITYRPSDSLTFEARYIKGADDVVILPHDQYIFSLYHALAPGLSPFVNYKNTLYSLTHLQSVNFGVEIEKFSHIIIVPQFMVGQASFNRPEDVKDVYNLGVRIMYYREQDYSFSVFAYKGTEAAQGLIGESARTIDTKSAGLSFGHYFHSQLKSEFIFDYTDLGQLDNQFLTSTLNLVWTY